MSLLLLPADGENNPLPPSSKVEQKTKHPLPETTKVGHKKETEHFISEIERYMNGIKSLESEFTQTELFNNGEQKEQTGHFYLKKHNKKYEIRIDFPAEKQKIFILDNVLMIVNADNKVISKNNISSTPIAFIFADNFNFRKKFSKYSVYLEPESKVISTDLFIGGVNTYKVTLYFKLYKISDNIEKLTGWTIRDSQGNLNVIKFDEKTMKANTFISDNLFAFDFTQKND